VKPRTWRTLRASRNGAVRRYAHRKPSEVMSGRIIYRARFMFLLISARAVCDRLLRRQPDSRNVTMVTLIASLIHLFRRRLYERRTDGRLRDHQVHTTHGICTVPVVSTASSRSCRCSLFSDAGLVACRQRLHVVIFWNWSGFGRLRPDSVLPERKSAATAATRSRQHERVGRSGS